MNGDGNSEGGGRGPNRRSVLAVMLGALGIGAMTAADHANNVSRATAPAEQTPDNPTVTPSPKTDININMGTTTLEVPNPANADLDPRNQQVAANMNRPAPTSGSFPSQELVNKNTDSSIKN